MYTPGSAHGPTSIPRHFPRKNLVLQRSLAFPDTLEARPQSASLEESHVGRLGREASIRRPYPLERVLYVHLKVEGREDVPQRQVLHNSGDRDPGFNVPNPPILREAILHRTRVEHMLIHMVKKKWAMASTSRLLIHLSRQNRQDLPFPTATVVDALKMALALSEQEMPAST